MKNFLCLVVVAAAALANGCGCGCGDSTSAQPANPDDSLISQNASAGDHACCEAPASAATGEAVALNAPPAVGGNWGTIKGQIVFDGEKLPERPALDVNKDQEHCLKNGPVSSEAWVVNPKNKGIQWVVVFLHQAPGKPLPIHEELKTPKGDAVLDQPQCAFVPHVLAMRADQKLLVKNPAPVIHTATFKGFKNDINLTLQAGENKHFTLEAERNAITLTCGIHPWMRGWVWVFEHPYFAVTDADGRFELKIAPSGPQRVLIWQESLGYLGGAAGRTGREVQVPPGSAVDLGAIKMKPSE